MFDDIRQYYKNYGFASVYLGLSVVLATIYISIFSYSTWAALDYPFPLEPAEIATFLSVLHIRNGFAAYAPPTMEYAGTMYTPLFQYLAAYFSRFFEYPIVAGRAISLISTLLTCCLTFHWLRKESSSRLLAYTAIGTYISCASEINHTFILCRVDCLFILFLVAGCYVIRFHSSVKGDFLAVLLFVLAVFTKQSTLFCLPPILLALFLSAPKRALFIGSFLAVSVLLLGITLNIASDGWFFFYTVNMISKDPIRSSYSVFLSRDLMFIIADAVLALRALLWLFGIDGKTGTFYFGMLAGFTGMSYCGRLIIGGGLNTLIPCYYAIILVSSVGLAKLVSNIDKFLPMYRRRTVSSGFGLFFVQLVIQFYDPMEGIPHDYDSVAGWKFVHYLEKIDGDILIPSYGFFQTYAGKTSYGWGTTATNIWQMSDNNKVKKDFAEMLERAFREKRFAAIILTDDDDKELSYSIADNLHFKKNYCFKEAVLDNNTQKFALYPPIGTYPMPTTGDWVPGWNIRPNRVYVPCKT